MNPAGNGSVRANSEGTQHSQCSACCWTDSCWG